jgi:hypothetical protein
VALMVWKSCINESSYSCLPNIKLLKLPELPLISGIEVNENFASIELFLDYKYFKSNWIKVLASKTTTAKRKKIKNQAQNTFNSNFNKAEYDFTNLRLVIDSIFKKSIELS